ncbi:DNA cytosine methyltransferase [Pseudomonas sp. LS-2]|uniref:DNA cytosine methyltransferase n=1 Tax=Pseudomonas sp. LS-2 TaxID=2315859 RepID=UPI000E7681B9|nr:DNA cytosine methyltransferase [Pseudomonas sp. LS-2]RJX72650.1 DNA cytosine methyltransferase [Pseudomonas sp. LS-2]
MTTILNVTIGETRSGVARVWMEGQKLLHAGVNIGAKYVVRADESQKRIELVPAEPSAVGEGVVTVSKRERNGLITPLLEIRTDLLKSFYDGCEKVRVAIRNGRLAITALHVEMKIRERVERLKQKIANKEKLACGTLFHGAGVMDKAIHSGLLAAGVAAFIQVGVEVNGDYLDASLRNNPELWTSESLVVNSDIRDLDLSNAMPQLDLLWAGIPCTGSSRAGKAKNKLKHAEEHDTAGTLFNDFLDFAKASNPAVILIENVADYAQSAGMAVIRSLLKSRGYDMHEKVLLGTDFGVLEARERMVFVAISKRLDVEFSFPAPTGKTNLKVADILEDIPLDSDRWNEYEYLAIKEKRDKEQGKNFRRQLISYNATSVGTMTRGYQRVRSTDPHLQHPTDPKLSRLFTPVEHARLKGVPASIVDGVADTKAHEILGQGVIGPVFEAVGRSIGMAITHQQDRLVEARLVVDGAIAVNGGDDETDWDELGLTDWDELLAHEEPVEELEPQPSVPQKQIQVALEFC